MQATHKRVRERVCVLVFERERERERELVSRKDQEEWRHAVKIWSKGPLYISLLI